VSVLMFDQTIQWWTPPEVIERWLAHLDYLEEVHAGDEGALGCIAIERWRVEHARDFGRRVKEDETGRLRIED
jgi:hypothetical protein